MSPDPSASIAYHSTAPIRSKLPNGDFENTEKEEARIREQVEYINAVNALQQPGSEWKLEQGLAGHELPVLDQTMGEDGIKPASQKEGPGSVGSNHIDVDDAREKLLNLNKKYDPAVVFAEEKEGWRGYGRLED